MAKRAKNSTKRMYLSYVKIGHYGSMSSNLIGPFTPGFNVVFGGNEAGKSTIASCVGDILYGWQSSRSGKNTYKPEDSDRSGSLVFTEGDATYEFGRRKNAEGLKDLSVIPYARDHARTMEDFLCDVDRETFNTMFSLTSDELRSLSRTSDMAATLFTAGSGTAASPVSALSDIEAQISELMSKRAAASHSLPRLSEALKTCTEKMAVLRNQADALREDEAQLSQLALDQQKIAQRRDILRVEISQLTKAASAIALIDDRYDLCEEDRYQIQQRIEALEQENEQQADSAALTLTESDDAEIRERLAHLQDDIRFYNEQVRLADVDYQKLKAHASAVERAHNGEGTAPETEAEVDAADRAAEESQAQFTPVLTTGPAPKAKPHRNFFVDAVVVGIIALVAMIYFFWNVFTSGEVVFLPFLVITALIAGIAAVIAVYSYRTRETEPETENVSRENISETVRLLEAEEKLTAAKKSVDDVERTTEAYLSGIPALQGVASIPQALRVLDELKVVRDGNQRRAHQLTSLRQSLQSVVSEQETLRKRKEQAMASVSLQSTLKAPDVEARAHEKEAEYASLQQQLESLHTQAGELRQRLSDGQKSHELDALKIQREQLQTRYRESMDRLAVLILSRRMLEESIRTWEGTRQPEVYKLASRLFSRMTNGRWTEIRVDKDGQLRIVDAVLTERAPIQLSLGTCQQMYLSLRIALLICAGDVGGPLPILADDILVNFDDSRRVGAIEALAELATHRQVVLFTCHREVVDLIEKHVPEITLINL